MPSEQEKSTFSNTIFNIVATKIISHFEAVLWYCKETDLEVEVAATLLSPKLKEMIATDAEELHMLAKTGKLPI